MPSFLCCWIAKNSMFDVPDTGARISPNAPSKNLNMVSRSRSSATDEFADGQPRSSSLKTLLQLSILWCYLLPTFFTGVTELGINPHSTFQVRKSSQKIGTWLSKNVDSIIHGFVSRTGPQSAISTVLYAIQFLRYEVSSLNSYEERQCTLHSTLVELINPQTSVRRACGIVRFLPHGHHCRCISALLIVQATAKAILRCELKN